MGKYLYGASVQGIQKFIFETDKLKEIVGGSEIVEYICTKLYKDFIDTAKVEVLLSAAGNIKIKSDSLTNLQKIVREFPKVVMEKAPGITISQAVVECKGTDFENVSELENLLKIQRNKKIRPIEITALGIERSRRTGHSAVESTAIREKVELLDLATLIKRNNSTGTSLIKKLKDNAPEAEFSKDMDQLLSEKCKWLAVIHADGNRLGKIIQNLKNTTIKDFSERLNEVTVKSAKEAFDKVIEKNKSSKGIYPLRPIIIGGDDLTVICRGDLALEFIKVYLKAFQDNGSKHKLTASAGIAFVKVSYPFHYAVELAEKLCGFSKNSSREKASVTFHKIQSSFVDSYSEIQERELTAGDVSFVNGPYFLDNMENESELDTLQIMVEKVLEKGSPKSGIRKWLTELHRDRKSADQLMDRICEITDSKYITDLRLGDDAIKSNKTHLYDLLTIASIMGGE